MTLHNLQGASGSPAMSPPMRIHIGGSNTVMVSPQPQLQAPPPLVHNASHYSSQPVMSSAPLTSQPPPLLHSTQTTGTPLPSINNLPTPVIHPNAAAMGKYQWRNLWQYKYLYCMIKTSDPVSPNFQPTQLCPQFKVLEKCINLRSILGPKTEYWFEESWLRWGLILLIILS